MRGGGGGGEKWWKFVLIELAPIVCMGTVSGKLASRERVWRECFGWGIKILGFDKIRQKISK